MVVHLRLRDVNEARRVSPTLVRQCQRLAPLCTRRLAVGAVPRVSVGFPAADATREMGARTVSLGLTQAQGHGQLWGVVGNARPLRARAYLPGGIAWPREAAADADLPFTSSVPFQNECLCLAVHTVPSTHTHTFCTHAIIYLQRICI